MIGFLAASGAFLRYAEAYVKTISPAAGRDAGARERAAVGQVRSEDAAWPRSPAARGSR